MADYAVGDIQGCLPPLERLLARVHFSPDRDLLWSVGDIVNRGPACLQTLRFLYERRDNLRLVLGNHDLHLLAARAGARTLSPSDTLGPILRARDSDRLLDWLQEQPLLRRAGDDLFVHAGIPPQWDSATAEARAREVEAALTGADCDRFFGHMYGNEPATWADDLAGWPRLRVITNCFTRMRFCAADGTLDLENKGPPPEQNQADREDEPFRPWFRHPHRLEDGERVIFGHWAALDGATGDPRFIGLDTGCVWGGELTFFNLASGERLAEPCGG
jgi:bis(5'-nucleosyl)-tetraphosphatase (symmetrical)